MDDLTHKSYDVAGSTNANAIVLLHGAAWSRKMWLPQMEALADEFRVIALDLPGHGELSSTRFQLDDVVREITRVVNLEKKDRVMAVGLSMGGYAAMKVAQSWPECVAGLVLSGATINYYGFVGSISKLAATISLKLFGERRIQQMQEKSVRRMFPASVAEPNIQAGFSMKAIPDVFGEVAKFDSRSSLRSLRCPVLILNGEKDKQNRRGESELVKQMTNAKLQIIENAGHACNLDQPLAFAAAIRAFAREINW